MLCLRLLYYALWNRCCGLVTFFKNMNSLSYKDVNPGLQLLLLNNPLLIFSYSTLDLQLNNIPFFLRNSFLYCLFIVSPMKGCHIPLTLKKERHWGFDSFQCHPGHNNCIQLKWCTQLEKDFKKKIKIKMKFYSQIIIFKSFLWWNLEKKSSII